MVKKTQSIPGKNTICLAFSRPDWFLQYTFSAQPNWNIEHESDLQFGKHDSWPVEAVLQW